MSARIHPTAIVDPGASLGADVAIGPYAIVGAGVEIGAGTVLAAHAVVRQGTILGERCLVDSHAVLGGDPQDLRFDTRMRSGVRLGDDVVVREGVTIHRATREGAFTEIGAGTLLMAYAHAAHDCVVGHHAIVANNVLLGGFVEIGPYAFLGGGAAFHQHLRVGESAMCGGIARCSQDVPPFSMVAERDELVGLNLVGLRRRGFSREAIASIKRAFTELYRGGGNLRERAVRMLDSPSMAGEEARRFLNFFTEGERGFARPHQARRAASFLSEDSP